MHCFFIRNIQDNQKVPENNMNSTKRWIVAEKLAFATHQKNKITLKFQRKNKWDLKMLNVVSTYLSAWLTRPYIRLHKDKRYQKAQNSFLLKCSKCTGRLLSNCSPKKPVYGREKKFQLPELRFCDDYNLFQSVRVLNWRRLIGDLSVEVVFRIRVMNNASPIRHGFSYWSCAIPMTSIYVA